MIENTVFPPSSDSKSNSSGSCNNTPRSRRSSLAVNAEDLPKWQYNFISTYFFKSPKEYFFKNYLSNLNIDLKGIQSKFKQVVGMHKMVSTRLQNLHNHNRSDFPHGKASCSNSFVRDFFDDAKEKLKVCMNKVKENYKSYDDDKEKFKVFMDELNEKYKFYDCQNSNPLGFLFQYTYRFIDDFIIGLPKWHSKNLSLKEKKIQESFLLNLTKAFERVESKFKQVVGMYEMVYMRLSQDLNNIRFDFPHGKASCLNECISFVQKQFDDEKEKFKGFMLDVICKLQFHHKTIIRHASNLKSENLKICNGMSKKPREGLVHSKISEVCTGTVLLQNIVNF